MNDTSPSRAKHAMANLSMVDCFRETETQATQLRQSKSDFDLLIGQLHSSAFVKQMNTLRSSIIN